MRPSPLDLKAITAALQAFARDQLGGRLIVKLTLELHDGGTLALPLSPLVEPGTTAVVPETEAFVPTAFQVAILDALDGKALRTDALAAAVGDRSRLFRHPGGLKELKDQGLVANHHRLGFYRVDAPPEALAEKIEETE